ncbi:MAG TPA: PQQ-dependent sugar dehydrogenase [Ktedonobacterales bacterium]|nr:PQQ-dependent sugar dehydrogenase [Ktedonobacterales bacterium]
MRTVRERRRMERRQGPHVTVAGRGRSAVHRALLITLGCALLLTACGPLGVAPAGKTPTAPPVTSSSATTGRLPDLTYLHLPSGFRATEYASGLRGARFITFGPSGALFVAERNTGRILALLDPGRQGRATQTVVVASGLNDPTSVVYADGALYVGEQTRVTRLTLGPDLRATAERTLISDLPSGGRHVTRTVLLGPDGALYVSIGSSCDACIESDPHRAAVWRYNRDGSGGRLYAHGLRNAVGMAVNPVKRQVWVTNNGRDNLGDNVPPDSVYALRDGGNYGWPRCHAGVIVDPDLGSADSCMGIVQPAANLQAHSAPLGLAFAAQSQFPPAYRGLYVAYHGSWNRSAPTGYKVVFIPLDSAGNVAGPPRDFATGWRRANGDVLGRPVGLAVGPDGALYVSDDTEGAIVRIAYAG